MSIPASFFIYIFLAYITASNPYCFKIWFLNGLFYLFYFTYSVLEIYINILLIKIKTVETRQNKTKNFKIDYN